MDMNVLTLGRCQTEELTLYASESCVGFAPEVGERLYVANAGPEVSGWHIVVSSRYNGFWTEVYFCQKWWKWVSFHNEEEGISVTNHYVTAL